MEEVDEVVDKEKEVNEEEFDEEEEDGVRIGGGERVVEFVFR